METFTVRDLRERTGKLIRSAEEGKLSIVTKQGKPVLVAVPFDESLLRGDVRLALAIKLFDEGRLTVAQAAKFAGLGLEEMIERTGTAGVSGLRQAED